MVFCSTMIDSNFRSSGKPSRQQGFMEIGRSRECCEVPSRTYMDRGVDKGIHCKRGRNRRNYLLTKNGILAHKYT